MSCHNTAPSIRVLNGRLRHCGGLIAFLAMLLFQGCRSSTKHEEPQVVSVAAASDLRFSLDEFIEAFQLDRAGVQVRVTYASSGSLHAQIESQAPYDIFLSADTDYPSSLVNKGYADSADLFTYAIGHLVLWAPNGSPIDVTRGLAALNDPAARKIAMANPRFAPYGRAAEHHLKDSGQAEVLSSKLVLADTVAQAAQYVQSGAADLGLISLSLAKSPRMQDQGRFWQFPDTFVLSQAGIILRGAHGKSLAQEFRAALTGDLGRSILSKHGFTLPER